MRVVLAVLALQAAVARAETFEVLTYAPPPGWAARAVQEGRSYARPDGSGVIVLYASQPEARAPAEAFAAMWRAQVEPAVPGPMPQPQVNRDGEFTVAVGARQRESASVSLVTFTGRGRTLGVVGIVRSDAAMRELLGFFESMKLPRAAAAAPAASAAPAVTTPIEGAWIRGSYKLDVTGRPGSASFAWEHLFFFKGGLASRQWNAEGFDGFDAAKAAADPGAQRWGTFGTRTESGAAVAIRWSNGGELALERKGRNLVRGSETPWLPLPPVDRLVLDGLYRRGDGKPSPAGVAETEIRFTPDGRFEEQGVLGAVMRDGPRQRKGRYRIASYTLHLEYDGGGRSRTGFYTLEKPHAKSEAIYLNTFIFSRAK